MKRSDFISVQIMCYKCRKVNFIHSGSCIDSADWIRKKKEIILKIQMINVFNMLQLLH